MVLEEPGIRAFRGPVISSAERDPTNKQERGSVPYAWFARDETKIADILRYPRAKMKMLRKVRNGITIDDLYGFLTTDANRFV